MGPQPDARPAVAVWHVLVRTGRAALVGSTLALALLGALVGPPSAVLVWAPGMAVVAAVVVAVVDPDFPRTPGSRRAAWLAGLAGFLLVPYTSGLGMLDAAGAVVVVLQLTMGALWAVDRIAAMPERTGAEALRRDVVYLRRVLPELPVEMLLREWRESGARLGPDTDAGTRAAAAELRALLLDELARRDPEAVERWLRTGGGDPDQHLPERPGP